MEIIMGTMLVIVPVLCGEAYSTKCIGLAPAVERSACDAIDAVNAASAVASSDLLPCALGYKDKSLCTANNCCWFKGECYQKPRICYSDFRNELCPMRLNFRPNSIYAGFSLNGTHCFIDIMKVHLQRQYYGDATSLRGVRILDQNEDPCVIRIKTKVSRIDSGKCNVTMLTEGVTSTGNSYANKCVVEDNSGTMLVFDFGLHDTCLCSIDAWLEEENDNTEISDHIRERVEQEELKSSCSRILGRILRRSWRSRINIVNKDEADVVVRTLLNVTEKTSSTKFDSNLLRNFVPRSEINEDTSRRRKRSTDVQESPTPTFDTNRIQWQIMKNLEEIVENIISLIEIPKNATSHVVRATAQVIDLRVAIAKSDSLSTLVGIGDEVDPAADNPWRASVTNITAPAPGGN